jgi:hypothetical protein
VSQPTPVKAIVDRILGGEAPLQLRSAAARGAIPVPRSALIRLHIHLLEDDDEGIRQEARASLDALGQDELLEVFGDEECTAEVLGHFADRALRIESLAELLVFHQAVPDAALSLLAAKGSASIIDLILTNQQRILTSPALLDRLTANPALRPDQRGRILDLLDRFISKQQDEDAAESEESAAGDATPEEQIEEAARILNVDVGELFAASEIMGGEELEKSEDPEIRDAYRKVMTLNTAQKAILAMKGGREERMILVRDTNKVVSLGVLRNPRMTKQDVEIIARMRNVSDMVLRALGSNREWVKSYAVITALVYNPKTPPGISTNFVSRMNVFDLKKLRRDKNVPEIIRKMAAKTLELREQRARPRFMKK